MTAVLQVTAGARRYEVMIGHNQLGTLAAHLRDSGIEARQVAVVTDEHVERLGYAERVRSSFASLGAAAHLLTIAAGDAHKTLATAETLYHRLSQLQFRRSGLVIAVGGGVVGDVAGFVAATYQRGVRYVQVPTTLLAHDSSIGGKVGVNLAEAKNLVGAFHQPVAVLFDPDVLETLPDREWRGGMAEVIKHGIIGNVGLFQRLADNPAVNFRTVQDVTIMVSEAMAVKIGIVAKDELDTGERMKLNLGHTLGHAVEQASGYTLSHGEAVSIGIVLESQIAHRKNWLDRQTSDLISSVLSRHGLPVMPPRLPLSAVLAGLHLDKKHSQTGWTFAVPFGIGDVRIVHDISEQDVVEVWPYPA